MAEGILIQHAVVTGDVMNVPIPNYGPNKVTKLIPLRLDMQGRTIVTKPVWDLLQAHTRPGEWTLVGTVANPPTQYVDQSAPPRLETPADIARRHQMQAVYADWCAKQDAAAAAMAELAPPGAGPGRITVGGIDPTRDRQRLTI